MVSLTQWKLLLTVNILLYSEAIAMASLSPNDPSSFSRPEIAVIRHVSLVLNVNFEEKTLEGTATYDIDVLQNKGKVVFDVTDQTIESVQLDDDVGTHLHYVVDREVINFGKKLSIFIPPLKDDQSERGAIISIGESLDTTEEQKEKEKKITTKRSFKSKWKHKSSECGNCTSIPVLDTEPYLKDSDNESQQSTDMSQMQMKSTATEMLNKSSKRVGQKKSEYGVAMLRKFFSEETLTKLYKGETLKFYKQEMLPTQLAFMTVHPCGCYRDEINTNKIAYHNTNLVSRSLCKLPSDPSYLSCRNCSPMSSETFGSVTSEDLESQIYKVSHKVGTDSELMQELPSCHYDVCDPVGVQGFNSSRHENKNYLNNPHIARVDSPMEQIKTEQIKNLRRCEN